MSLKCPPWGSSGHTNRIALVFWPRKQKRLPILYHGPCTALLVLWWWWWWWWWWWYSRDVLKHWPSLPVVCVWMVAGVFLDLMLMLLFTFMVILFFLFMVMVVMKGVVEIVFVWSVTKHFNFGLNHVCEKCSGAYWQQVVALNSENISINRLICKIAFKTLRSNYQYL